MFYSKAFKTSLKATEKKVCISMHLNYTTYICVSLYIYTYIHTCVYIDIHMHTHIYTCSNT